MSDRESLAVVCVLMIYVDDKVNKVDQSCDVVAIFVKGNNLYFNAIARCYVTNWHWWPQHMAFTQHPLGN